jgi:hypothetical protein
MIGILGIAWVRPQMLEVRFFFVIFEGIAEFLKDLDVLMILIEFFFCAMDGSHEFAVGFGREVMGRVVINELPELQRAQFSTDL